MGDDPAAKKREQARIRQRKRRDRLRAEQSKADVVTQLAPSQRDGRRDGVMVAVFEAVAQELEGLPETERRPGVAAAALRMAAVLDDPSAAPQAPQAAKTLVDLLRTLREGAPERVGKLHELRAREVSRHVASRGA